MRRVREEIPKRPLVADSQYWLGESFFQRQRYRDAAEAFLGVTTKYDTCDTAPDALLRLGQSLAALKEKEAACAAFGEVTRKYPRASAGVKQAVDREQKRQVLEMPRARGGSRAKPSRRDDVHSAKQQPCSRTGKRGRDMLAVSGGPDSMALMWLAGALAPAPQPAGRN